jgi:two-component system CheB/CheR fusion protein
VLLDERLRVLQVHGDVAPFLQIRPGLQTGSVLSMAHPDIENELRLLCALPGDESHDTHQSEVTLAQERHRRRWMMVLHGCPPEAGARRRLLAFLPVRPRSRRASTPVEAEGARAAELADARERMKSLIEQLEAFNEEMQALNEEAQAANEELQAANEELQASNEELEAANAELQATNQELATVNEELGHQWRRHQHLAEELQGIQDSIPMPLLVVDEQYRIHRYNAAAERLFQLRAGGAQGLPLATMHRPPGIPDLLPLVAQALGCAGPLAVDLRVDGAPRDYTLHLSHCLLEGERHGVVLTLVDDTELARERRQRQRLERRLQALLGHGTALTAIKDGSGRYECVNAPYAAFLDQPSADAMAGCTDAQLLPPDIAAVLRQGDLELLRDGSAPEQAQTFVIAAQQRAWRVTRFVLPDADGVPEGIGLQAIDVTASRQTDAALRVAARVFDVSSEGIMILDAHGRIERVNRALCQLCGQSEPDLLGQPPSFLDSRRNPPDLLATLQAQVAAQGSWQGEVWSERADRTLFPGWLSASALTDDDGRMTHVIIMLSDITTLTETRETLRHLATHDTLTGLPNRTLLMDRVSHAIDNARRQRSEIALCFIDLDHFKTINDSFGHDAGDEVLRLAARRIGDCVRACDTLARIGGDEFVLLLEHTSRHESLLTVQRISGVLSGHMEYRGNVLSTGASIGVAHYPGDASDAATLLSHADAAMYRAKKAGRGQHEFYSSEIGNLARQRLHIESGLRQALSRQELVLHYQPQVSLGDRQVIGLEALLRWRPGGGKVIAPSVFLPIAEESALIDQIGEWALDEACGQLAQWRASGHADLTMSVNISSRQLRDRSFVDRLQQILITRELPGEHLILEITESALLRHDSMLDTTMQRLETLGIQVSLDDFGTGYSSLAHLRHLPLSELKIDRSFVQGMADQRDDREIVEAIIGLGRTLGLRIVAEGVETEVLRDCLARQRPAQGPDDLVIQGHWIARPMPAPDCGQWLKTAALTTHDA